MDRTTSSSGRPEVIDIIVVAYRNDIFLLELQARSIVLNIDPTKIANIYVCINDDDHYCEQVNKAWWGNLSNKIIVVPRSYFGVDTRLDGWSSQQLYKLLLANQAESSWSICLDSKTWFVKPLEWHRLFDINGKVLLRSFPTIPVFKPAQNFIEEYFTISSPLVVGPGGVPFMFHTETVKDMCMTIPDFFNFFCIHVNQPNFLTEFMLYSGFVTKKYGSHLELYSDSQYYTFFNIADWQVCDFDNIWHQSYNSKLLTISIQERAYAHLSDQQFNIWIEYLKTKHLLTAEDPIVQKLNTLR